MSISSRVRVMEELNPTFAVEGEGSLYSCKETSLERRKELYSGLKARYSWGAYFLGFQHLAAYVACAVVSWCCLVDGGSLFWCIPLGWAWYCIWMIGHESYHNTMAPSKLMNEWIGYLTMDMLVSSRSTWKYSHHMIHHRKPLSPQDRQRLFGPCVFTETLNIIFTVLQYWYYDFVSLFRAPTVWKAAAIVTKYHLMLRLPLNALIGFVFSLGVNCNYCALLAHAAAVNKPSSDSTVHQLRTSLDIFPTSVFCTFLTGALNAHSTHHVFPALPRSLQPSAAVKLARFYPDEYRVVDDFITLGALWTLRHF